jgi:release factor glutamine methyltransferase
LSAARPAVGAALRAATARLEGAGRDGARLDAEVLLAHVLGAERIVLITGRDRVLDAAEEARLEALIARRAAGEPVAYLVGEREFYSLPFAVDRRVLIPRPETEGVVDAALDALGQLLDVRAREARREPVRVLDVCTGSGAIAVTVGHEAARRFPDASLVVLASDLSCDALAVARDNAARLLPPGALPLLRADLAGAVRGGAIDLLLANPPYLSDDDLTAISTEVAAEPVDALRGGGKDGTRILRALLTDAVRVLAPGGFVVSEIGASQGAAVATLARGLGFATARVLPDLAGLDRVLVARWRNESRAADGN